MPALTAVLPIEREQRQANQRARSHQQKRPAESLVERALERVLDPKGIMVMLEAEHTCMTMRGIKKPGSKTITTVTRGEFKENMELQKQFLAMVKD